MILCLEMKIEGIQTYYDIILQLRHGKCQNDQTGKPRFDMLLLSSEGTNCQTGRPWQESLFPRMILK